MADVLLANGRLLYVLPYFGIKLGFGEKTIGQICAEGKISKPLFLLICNHYSFEDYVPGREELRLIPIGDLVEYLQKSHWDYINIRIPGIIERVLSLTRKGSLIDGNMIVAFCEKYRQQIMTHLQYEDEVVFPYIYRILGGGLPDCRIDENEVCHSDIDSALTDLKNIIIKYLPYACEIRQSRPVLLDLFDLDYELHKHSKLEDTVLMPLIHRLDSRRLSSSEGVEFSEREKETLIHIARGLSNKEIAEKLFLSPHTVISHRRNIIRKTGIKTAQGLAIYALLNNIISKDDL
jgi:regulator of cell morphogenesis and NO signaling